MKNFFYNKIIWNYTAAFADLFKDMEVWIYDENGKAISKKQVPVYLTPKEKVVSMLQRQGRSDTFPGGSAIDNYMPSITIVWTGVQLDAQRMRGQKEKRKLYVKYEDGESPVQHLDLQTVPYILNYEVSIWANYMDDAAQLLENILPFFHPEAFISIYEKSLGTERKCKVQLDSITPQFVYELDGSQRRVIQFNLGFSVEVNMYKPELPVGKPIQEIQTKFGIATNNEKASGEVVTSSLSGANTYYNFDDEIFTNIRDLTQDESFNIANKYFNDVGQIRKIRLSFSDNEEPDTVPANTVDSMLSSYQQDLSSFVDFDQIILDAGFSIPLSASQQEYTTLLFKSLYKLNDPKSNPLKYGQFTINKDGTVIFIPET